MFRINKTVGLLVFMFVVLSLVFSQKAHAAKVEGAITATPTGHRTICNAGTPVDFSAYPSNVDFDARNGTVTFNINLKWQRCSTASETRAYAIYGNQEICPQSGFYGNIGNGYVYDCLKYIGSPAYSGTSALSCFGGTQKNDQCVTDQFGAVRRVENQPSTGAGSITIPMSASYPNWSSTPASGNWVISGSMCQFYKTGASTNNINSDSTKRCIDININMNWYTPDNNSTCEKFTGGFGLPAAASGQDIALANTSGQIIGTSQVSPGQDVLLGVKFKNTGNVNWQPALGVYAIANSATNITLAPAPSPYNGWSVNDGSTPKLVYMQSGSTELPPGGTANFWFKVTLPGSFPNNKLTLAWRMRQTVAYNSQNAETFGETCSISLRIPINKPYVRFGGSDVVSGAVFGPNQCADVSSADRQRAAKANIYTAGEYSYGPGVDTFSAAFNGISSSQYAVFASGEIGNNGLSTLVAPVADSQVNFAGNNAFMRDYGGQVNRIKDLTAASDTKNGGVGGASGVYGGFASSDSTTAPNAVYCVDTTAYDNAFSSTPLTAAGVSVDSVANDPGYTSTYVHYANLNIGATTIPAGRRLVVLVDGATTISGDISLGAYGGDVSQIPYITIVSRGPIVITSGVRNIAANLVAEPNPTAPTASVRNVPNAGIIDTCGSGSSPSWPASMTVSNCRRPLTVTGSVQAPVIYWKGTYGTIGQPDYVVPGEPCPVNNGSIPGGNYFNALANRLSTCAAERILFNPALYLSNPLNDPSEREPGVVNSVPRTTKQLPPIY